MMKRVLGLMATAAFAIAIFGCAGSKTDGGGGDTGVVTNIRIEAVFQNNTDRVIDPLNIETGEEIIFRLVGDRNGAKVILTPGPWNTSDTSFTYGVLAANSGRFLAGNRPSPQAPLIAFTSFNGMDYSTFYRVNPRQVRLAGNVVNEDTAEGVGNVEIEFFDNSGLPVARVRTAPDGSFLASVPVTVDSFQITDASVPPAFFRSFVYEGMRYDTGRFVCRVIIPSFDPGPRQLPDDILLTPNKGGPKPEPDGCVP